MATMKIRPLDVEAQFRIEELFFSTTDAKGIIETGNTVFARVSGYPYDELVGRPHNIIRHPDMPRTVFKLLWDYLEAGKPIAAYVKNMAVTGQYYWVVALVTPLPRNAYLSIRFKPSSALFPLVEKVYQELKEIETKHGDQGNGRQEGMRAGTERLNTILKEHGFESYDDFMATVLRTELKSRDHEMTLQNVKAIPAFVHPDGQLLSQQLSQVFDEGTRLSGDILKLFARIDDFINLSESLEKDAAFVLELAQSLQLISMNASVESAKIRGNAPSLGVIAEHLGSTSRNVTHLVTDVRKRIHHLTPQLSQVGFGLAASRLQIEMLTSFCAEFVELVKNNDQHSHSNYLKHAGEMIRSIEIAFRTTFSQIVALLEEIERPLLDLGNSSEELRKTILTLMFSQLVGTVEATPLGNQSNFKVIFEEIKGQIYTAKEQLIDLNRSVTEIYDQLRSLPVVTSVCAERLDCISSLTASMI